MNEYKTLLSLVIFNMFLLICMHVCFQAVINLLNVLSSFPALYEAIKRDIPSSQVSAHSSVSISVRMYPMMCFI